MSEPPVMMRRSTQPDQQRAAAEVLRNSGHPPASGAHGGEVARVKLADVGEVVAGFGFAAELLEVVGGDRPAFGVGEDLVVRVVVGPHGEVGHQLVSSSASERVAGAEPHGALGLAVAAGDGERDRGVGEDMAYSGGADPVFAGGLSEPDQHPNILSHNSRGLTECPCFAQSMIQFRSG